MLPGVGFARKAHGEVHVSYITESDDGFGIGNLERTASGALGKGSVGKIRAGRGGSVGLVRWDDLDICGHFDLLGFRPRPFILVGGLD